MRVWLGGIVILASCEHQFIRVHENLVQHPSNNILIPVQKLPINFSLIFIARSRVGEKFELSKILFNLCIILSLYSIIVQNSLILHNACQITSLGNLNYWWKSWYTASL